jgi:hypothetical protein
MLFNAFRLWIAKSQYDGIVGRHGYVLAGQHVGTRLVNQEDQPRRPLVRVVETDGDVVRWVATTPKGNIEMIAKVTRDGDTLHLNGLHIDGPGGNELGIRGIRDLAVDLGRQHGVKKLVVHGGTRTTGANPGRVPRPVTFPVGD